MLFHIFVTRYFVLVSFGFSFFGVFLLFVFCFSFYFIIAGEKPAKQEWCPRYSAGKGIDLTWWGGGQPDLDGINIDF